MNIALKCHVMLALLIVLAMFSCGNESENGDPGRDPFELRDYVFSQGEATKRRIKTYVRDSDVPEGLIYDPLGNLDLYHHSYIPRVREVRLEEVQWLCKSIHDEREKFRSTVRPKLYLGIQRNILVPEDAEHVAYVRASQLYWKYIQEFGGWVHTCGIILTNKEESDW